MVRARAISKVDGPFSARLARKMVAKHGDPEAGRIAMVRSWTEARPALREKARLN